MNLTLSVDEQVVERARKTARAMGKSLNQVIREHLERLAGQDMLERDIAEFRALSGRGTPDPDWTYRREDAYDRALFSRQ